MRFSICAFSALSDLPLKSFKPFFSVMWLGFGINAISGVFLLIAYPTKAFTNPVFYLKLLLIASPSSSCSE